MTRKILISAGEASGDLYGAHLTAALRRRSAGLQFFGCAGPRMQAEGVRPVVDASSLAVVGLVEVVTHIPRIYGEFRRICEEARRERPELAILIDSPDFHLRLARRLKQMGIPVVYLVAPQAWAWREGRTRHLKRNVSRLLCIFPFEKSFFERHGVATTYVGHPLTRIVRPTLDKIEFFRKHRLPPDRPVVALLPGSRRGEMVRHLPALVDAATRLNHSRATTFLLGVPSFHKEAAFLAEKIEQAPIRVIQGETWDVIAHADLALAASGTVTVEAALLGTPMVTFYKVTGLSWLMGRLLVRVPFYSMVNLIAERRIVPELMQSEMTGDRLAAEARKLLENPAALAAMRQDLHQVKQKLSGEEEPIEMAARIVEQFIYKEVAHAS